MGFVEDTMSINPSIRILTKVYEDDIVIDEEDDSGLTRKFAWKTLVFIYALFVPFFLIVFDSIVYEPRKSIILPGVALVGVSISILSWIVM